jgi:hypothetical protein
MLSIVRNPVLWVPQEGVRCRDLGTASVNKRAGQDLKEKTGWMHAMAAKRPEKHDQIKRVWEVYGTYLLKYLCLQGPERACRCSFPA